MTVPSGTDGSYSSARSWQFPDILNKITADMQCISQILHLPKFKSVMMTFNIALYKFIIVQLWCKIMLQYMIEQF